MPALVLRGRFRWPRKDRQGQARRISPSQGARSLPRHAAAQSSEADCTPVRRRRTRSASQTSTTPPRTAPRDCEPRRKGTALARRQDLRRPEPNLEDSQRHSGTSAPPRPVGQLEATEQMDDPREREHDTENCESECSSDAREEHVRAGHGPDRTDRSARPATSRARQPVRGRSPRPPHRRASEAPRARRPRRVPARPSQGTGARVRRGTCARACSPHWLRLDAQGHRFTCDRPSLARPCRARTPPPVSARHTSLSRATSKARDACEIATVVSAPHICTDGCFRGIL